MEIMILEESLEDSYSSLEKVNWVDLAKDIEKSPGDYVFILSPEELSNWIRLHLEIGQKIEKTKTEEELMYILNDLAKRVSNNPLIFISLLSANRQIGETYRIGSLTPADLTP